MALVRAGHSYEEIGARLGILPGPGGIIRHVLETGSWFRNYVERLRAVKDAGTSEIHGSGGAGMRGDPQRDPPIQHPRCGIQALRGHTSIQGSTDIPTLVNMLPGYLAMPHADEHESLEAHIEGEVTEKGYWQEMRSHLISLLKAWWGPAASSDNDFCMGENPAVGSANAKRQRLGLVVPQRQRLEDQGR